MTQTPPKRDYVALPDGVILVQLEADLWVWQDSRSELPPLWAVRRYDNGAVATWHPKASVGIRVGAHFKDATLEEGVNHLLSVYGPTALGDVASDRIQRPTARAAQQEDDASTGIVPALCIILAAVGSALIWSLL